MSPLLFKFLNTIFWEQRNLMSYLLSSLWQFQKFSHVPLIVHPPPFLLHWKFFIILQNPTHFITAVFLQSNHPIVIRRWSWLYKIKSIINQFPNFDLAFNAYLYIPNGSTRTSPIRINIPNAVLSQWRHLIKSILPFFYGKSTLSCEEKKGYALAILVLIFPL